MAEINFLPVCSNCGAVLYGERINIEDEYIRSKVFGYNFRIIQIYPHACPKCNIPFDKITMPTELPFVKEGES